MSIRIAGQVIASAGSLTAHNEDPNAHADIRELISQGGGSEAKWGAITGDINAQTDLTAAIAVKQDKLTAGENITIEGNVISATGGGELPDNVYTQDNLIAGENITFSEVLPEGGIDEHTLSCFHLDGTAVDEVTGYTLHPTMDNGVHKFGTGSSMWVNSTSFPWGLNNYNDFSFDYWVYVPNASRNDTRLGLQGMVNSLYTDLGMVCFDTSGAISFKVFGNTFATEATVELGIWTHIYVYYKAEDKTFHLFVDGKEVLSTQISEEQVFSGAKNFINNGYTVSRFDEIRISDCIRWTEDFTPPTEPYTLATGPSKKAINAVIPEVELPDTVYTQDNLVAGDNIEIKEVVNPNVIDDNTLLCWHFDGDTKDVVKGENFTLYPDYGALNTTYYKFGSGSAPDYVQNGLNIALGETLTDQTDFTVDYWIKGIGADVSTLSFTSRFIGNNYTDIYFRAFGNDSNLLDVSDSNGNAVGSLSKQNTISTADWSHWAFTYNKETRDFTVYANGVKQGSLNIPVGNTFEIASFYPVHINYNQFLIDELRITKSLAWEKDFTPPTEAYAEGDGVAKKAINAIIPPVELPSDLYRQTNLLGGKDIEIVPEPVEGGIDEYTTGMWHFDNSMYDEINNKGFSYDRVGTYIDGKFGKGVYSVYGGRTDSEILCENQSVGSDFTIDCVVLPKDTSSSGTILHLYAGAESGDYYGLSVAYSMIGGSVTLGHRNATLVSKNLTPLTSTDKPHLALQRRGNLAEVFIDGKKEIEYDISSIATEFIGTGFGVNSANRVGIDELRISNIARYTEDFTPPTKAYSVAEPTGNMVINFTGKAGEAVGNGKSIGEVYYSQSSLSTDNAGALPLFTGETITSANTIYPDFYTWVESHTELQTTAEEYETALTTYGECPKYVVSDGSLRLPKLTNYIKMANSTDGVTQSEAGLPNIVGSAQPWPNQGNSAVTGPFTLSASGGNGGLEDWTSQRTLNFDASIANPIYGNSETVTPSHTTLFPWVVAYTASIEASTAQAAEFQEGLSGKADTDLGNTYPSTSFKKMSVGWGLPDYSTAVEVSLPYTATYPCYIATGPNDITFEMFINEEKVYYSVDGGNGLNSQSAYFWLDTGDVIRATGNPSWVKCFALKGVNND